MIRKILFILFALIALNSQINAQGIEFFFSTLPNKYLVQLDQTKRQVLLNKFRNQKDSTILNNYMGESKLLICDEENEYIRMQTSSQGNWAAKKFTLPDGEPLFALCNWVCAPACDGDLSFFKGNNITPVKSNNFVPLLQFKDFFIADSLLAYDINPDKVEDCFDMIFVHYEPQQNSDTLLVIIDNETYMGEKDFAKWRRRMKGNKLPLIWKGNEFAIGEAFFDEK